MKKWIKAIILVVFGVAVTFTSITTVDHTPFQEADFAKGTLKQFNSLHANSLETTGDTVQVGWAKINLTPSYITSLAGYGQGDYRTVRDSIWVRAFVFDNSIKRVGLLIPDLLIFPPEVKSRLEKELGGRDLDGVFYSATHTHHSIGNWHPGIVGRLFAGKYDESVVDSITSKCIAALSRATENLERTKIGFAAIQAEELVYNRLVPDKGHVDPWLRMLLLQRDDGKNAVITSFSAHATTIRRDSMILHRDYPGELVDRLESIDDIHFSAFMAGAVASHGPGSPGNSESKTAQISQSAADQIQLILNVIRPDYFTSIGYNSFPVSLREPHWRISQSFRIRPWLFNRVFSRYSASLTTLTLGR